MARSVYIYLIYYKFKGQTMPLSAHTVRREAHEWVMASKYDFDEVDLFRMRDNHGETDAEFINWDN